MANQIDRPKHLLSIDIESQLWKIADFTFPSSSHYPVELVRLALRRGASRIDIQTTGNRLVMADNGQGIAAEELADLTTIMDSNQSSEKRERGVEDFRDRLGTGLLILFSSLFVRVIIENVREGGKSAFILEKNRLRRGEFCSIAAGTRLTIQKRSRNFQGEISQLNQYLRGIKKEIFLNQTPIGNHPPLDDCLATVQVKGENLAVMGTVGIPRQGNVCVIWLLDHGIPWFHSVIHPWKGFIFQAALEYQEELDQKVLAACRNGAVRLYQWACDQYPSWPPRFQERTEELVFKHYKLTGDSRFLDRFSPFSVLHSRRRLNFAEIVKESSRQSLYFIPADGHLSDLNSRNKLVLLLNEAQIDFLVNENQIPLQFLSSSPVRMSWRQKWPFFFREKFQAVFSRFHWKKRRVIPPDKLTGPEIILLEGLQRYLAKLQKDDLLYGSRLLKPQLIASRGIFPVVKLNGSLFIRRHHPLVRKAIRSVSAQTDNIEWIAPLLILP